MRIFLIVLICVVGMLSSAQDLDNFTALKSTGHIPEEFLKRSSEKYKEDLEANKNEELDKNFFLSTRFVIDEILLSGNVLFNDPLSDYVKDVAKYALRKDKKLFEDLDFYVLKTNVANAFSTDQGIIFVTTGLLAQLENEAQLAFILCHEISHYTQHHVQDSYVERQQILRGRNKYRNLSYGNRVKELSIYSKETELDADSKGIDLYLKSEYSIDEVISSFEVLLYSYLPFGDVEFDTTFFNTDVMIVPGAFFPDTIREITKEEDYDDEGSSHPNIKTRIDKAFDYINDGTTRGEYLHRVSKERFEKVRSLARFENINSKLAERNYTSAIYDIFLLKRKFSENKFLDVSLMKALYGLMKYKNHKRFNEVRKKLKKVEGESYRLHAFIQNLSKGQLTVLTYRSIYDLIQKYPEDKILQKYHSDIKTELAVNSDLELDKFRDKPYAIYKDSLDALVKEFDIEDSIRKVDDSDLTKYKKIKLKKKLRALLSDNNISEADQGFHYYALYDVVANGEFISELKSIRNAYDESENENETVYLDDRKSHNLGVDSIVIFDPFLMTYNVNGRKNLEKSEAKKIELNFMYLDAYPNLDLERNLIDSKDLTKYEVNKYNDIGQIYNWAEEVTIHEDLDMISSSHDRMVNIKQEYGTSNFLFSGISLYKSRKEMTGVHWLGILFVYTIPIVALDLLIVHHNIDYSAVLIDAESDKIVYIENIDVSNRGSKRNLNFLVYHVLHNINSREK